MWALGVEHILVSQILEKEIYFQNVSAWLEKTTLGTIPCLWQVINNIFIFKLMLQK